VFIIPKIGLICKGNQAPLGPPLAKKMQLQRLGYIPMIIPILKYEYAREIHQKQNVIISKIMSEIDKIKQRI